MARKATPTKPSVPKATDPEDVSIFHGRIPYAVVEQYEGMLTSSSKPANIKCVGDRFVVGFLPG